MGHIEEQEREVNWITGRRDKALTDQVRVWDARAGDVKGNTGGSRCWKASRLPTGASKRRQTGQTFSLEPGSLPIHK